jgi:hypothetical protein
LFLGAGKPTASEFASNRKPTVKGELAEISAAVDYSSENVEIVLAAQDGIDAHSDQKQQDFASTRQP